MKWCLFCCVRGFGIGCCETRNSTDPHQHRFFRYVDQSSNCPGRIVPSSRGCSYLVYSILMLHVSTTTSLFSSTVVDERIVTKTQILNAQENSLPMTLGKTMIVMLRTKNLSEKLSWTLLMTTQMKVVMQQLFLVR